MSDLHAITEQFLEEQKIKEQKRLEELNFLEKLMQEKYPDLERHVNRWNTERFTSMLVNDQVTDFEVLHSCGCCPDAVLNIWPYLEEEGPNGKKIKIYAKGIPFGVGEKYEFWDAEDRCHASEIPWAGWENKLREAKIPEEIIERVSELFD